jgi:Holliday junction resolvasome RuvABC endonuclease subunit
VEIRNGAMASYLGIDASLEGTGLCLVSDDDIVLFKTVNPRGKRGMARLAMIKDEALKFFWRPKLLGKAPIAGAAVEGYAYNAVNQAFSLGEVGGMLRLILHEHGVPYVDVPPASLKKFATGFASADKSAMIAAAKACDVSPEDDNQADAYHLAKVALALVERPARRCQLEVIHQLTSPAKGKTRRQPRRLVENPI